MQQHFPRSTLKTSSRQQEQGKESIFRLFWLGTDALPGTDIQQVGYICRQHGCSPLKEPFRLALYVHLPCKTNQHLKRVFYKGAFHRNQKVFHQQHLPTVPLRLIGPSMLALMQLIGLWLRRLNTSKPEIFIHTTFKIIMHRISQLLHRNQLRYILTLACRNRIPTYSTTGMNRCK
jgi:hypothetical protein